MCDSNQAFSSIRLSLVHFLIRYVVIPEQKNSYFHPDSKIIQIF
jgi:hypothetical protein